jgi:hypothetical protein
MSQAPVLQAWTLQVLGAIAQHGPIRLGELNELPQLQPRKPQYGCRGAVGALYQNEMIQSEHATRTGPKRGSTYTVTAKGQLALRASGGDDSIDATRMPTPRQPIPKDTYTGGELLQCVRPGAMRAFDLPSLQNGVPVPRARPSLLGSTAVERKPS